MTLERTLARRWTAGEALRSAGWLALLASCVLLAEPASGWLFAADAEALTAPEREILEPLRLWLGVGGLALLALAARPAWARRELPVQRGQVALATVTLLLCLGVAEVGLRLHQWRRWGSALATPLSLASMRPEGTLYPRPGSYTLRTVSDYDPDQSVLAFIAINRYGLRGPLPELPKPAGRVRVVALGGSTTFAFVSDGLDWPARVQHLLAAEHPIEVLNAGRPGSTTWTDFHYLRDRLVRMQPDVLLLLEGFNDMWRGVKQHFAEQPDYGIVSETAPASEGPLDLGKPRRWPLRLSFGSYFLGRYLDNYLDARSDAATPRPQRPLRFAPAVVDIYASNLRAMIRLARAHGARPVLITFPGCDDAQASPDEQRRRLRYVLERNPEIDASSAQAGLELYRETTREVARSEDVPLIDAAQQMTKDPAVYTDTVHLTPEGEARLAAIIAPGLAGVLAGAAAPHERGESVGGVGD